MYNMLDVSCAMKNEAFRAPTRFRRSHTIPESELGFQQFSSCRYDCHEGMRIYRSTLTRVICDSTLQH